MPRKGTSASGSVLGRSGSPKGNAFPERAQAPSLGPAKLGLGTLDGASVLEFTPLALGFGQSKELEEVNWLHSARWGKDNPLDLFFRYKGAVFLLKRNSMKLRFSKVHFIGQYISAKAWLRSAYIASRCQSKPSASGFCPKCPLAPFWLGFAEGEGKQEAWVRLGIAKRCSLSPWEACFAS